MKNISTTRNLFELRVGSSHTIEVLFQLRRADIRWWNSSLGAHERQLFKLIQRRILPLECSQEIEEFRAKTTKKEEKSGDNIENKVKRKKREVIVGEINLRRGEKEKRGSNGKGAKKNANATKANILNKKKQSKSLSGTLPESVVSAANSDATTMEVRQNRYKILRGTGAWMMGHSIQICYNMEHLDRSSASTLIFRPGIHTSKGNVAVVDSDQAIRADRKDNDAIPPSRNKIEAKYFSGKKPDMKDTGNEKEDEQEIPLAAFRRLNKLPKRLVLWVFRFDPNNPLELSTSEGGGFPRPELLPLSDIFRSPNNGEE